MDAPDVNYARSGDVNVAYAVIGDGPFDLVLVGGWVVSNLASAWEGPAADFFTRLAEAGRVILFDKRGTGLSDRMGGVDDLETRMDDVRAVMDAVGSKRAAVMGVSEGGPMTVLFAATYPERVAAAVLSTPRVSATAEPTTTRGHRRLKSLRRPSSGPNGAGVRGRHSMQPSRS